MSKTSLALILLILYTGIVYPQDADHIEGGYFLKRIEYNVILPGVTEANNGYNLDGKSILDRIFFGKTNSFIEYTFDHSFEGASGFRIIKNSSNNTYLLEVFRLPDSEELSKTKKVLSAQVNQILIPGSLLAATSLNLSDMEKINEHNKEVIRFMRSDDLYKPYRPKHKSFKVSKELAENNFLEGKSDIVYGDGNKMEMLGLFMGISGFGYTMLRFHDWKNMPSILALEVKPDNLNIH